MTLLIEFEKKRPHFKQQFLRNRLILTLLLCSCTTINLFAQGGNYAVMEVVEIEFNSQEQYDNAYMDVDVWVELKKSGSATEVYRIPIFWDGDNVFRARLVATSPGNWTWNIINSTVENSDSGFINKNGSFSATAANVSSNPNNRGFLRVAANNRTLEYADGTPFFYTADTSWSALTSVFDYEQANSITGISFKDYILARKNQGFNGLNVIASFPDDSYLEEPGRNLDLQRRNPPRDGGLWSSETWGKKTGPNGETPFELKTQGEPYTDALREVDYKKIVPEYWQSVDQRMQFLSDQGFVTLFESVRRHERWAFRAQDEKDAFYNYVRYLWARYGCYNMIFSWVHHDSQGSIYPNWRELVEHAHEELSAQLGNQMPYGQPRTAMSFNTSLNNWERDLSDALDIQNVSNAERDETMHEWLSDIFAYEPAKPALNLEPFYPGWGLHSGNEINPGLDDTTQAQMQMYGSVLSGGLAGHAWGDAWYAGAAASTRRNQENGGTIVPDNDPQVNALNRFESQAMGHLKNFILDSGHEYHRLQPAADTHLSNSQNFKHTLSISDDEEFALGFFTADSRSNPAALPVLRNLKASERYLFEWWNVTDGGWTSAGNITTNNNGTLQPPTLPNNDRTKNWAYRIRSENYIGGDTTPPMLTLIGAAEIDLELGETYEELGATATDVTDGNLSADIVIGGDEVDTGIAGTYVVTYDVSDSDGNNAERLIRTVNVTDGSSQNQNSADSYINLALVTDAVLSSSVGTRGTLEAILYDPVANDYFMPTNYNEYGVGFRENLGRPDADDGFVWRVDWSSAKLINYITFGGTYPNQPQPNSLWRISYLSNGSWTVIEEGQGGWIDNGIFEWGGGSQSPISADALRVQVYSDGENDLESIHLRGRGGISNNIDDSATATKATLIQYLLNTGVDTTPPMLTLTGAAEISLELGDRYEELGATATDATGSDLTSAIVIGGDEVDTSNAGTYVVTYDVSDSDGNNAERLSRTVNVTDGSSQNQNSADSNINLALVTDAVLSGNAGTRGSLEAILYDPVADDYFVRTIYNEYGIGFRENLGRPGADDGFVWRVDWSSSKLINYITFGGTYPNQSQPNSLWRISYLNNGSWTVIEEGQGGWIDRGIFEWGGNSQSPISADALRVQVYSDGANDLESIHLRGRGGISNFTDDSATTTKATLIQYLPSSLSGKIAQEELNKMSISPNPAIDTTALSFEKPVELTTILIYDVLGRLVHTYNGSEVADQDTYTLQVDDLESGTYFINSIDAQGVRHQKQMVIKK